MRAVSVGPVLSYLDMSKAKVVGFCLFVLNPFQCFYFLVLCSTGVPEPFSCTLRYFSLWIIVKSVKTVSIEMYGREPCLGETIFYFIGLKYPF